MTEPIYGPYSEQMWNRLPEIYRIKDADTGWQLKRYLHGVGATYDNVMALFERFLFVPPNDRSPLAPKPSLMTDPINIVYPELILSPDDGTTWKPAVFRFDIDDDGMGHGIIYYDDSDMTITDNGDGTATMAWDDNNGVFDVAVSADGYSAEIDWTDLAGSQEAFYELMVSSEGAYAAASVYLQAGTYQIIFDYIDFATNGTAVIEVDEVIVGTVPLNNAGTGSVKSSFPVTFTVNRGWITIKFVFLSEYQSGADKLINIGAIRIVNTAPGPDLHTTSDLADPYAADIAWLPWLAQLVGVVIDQSQDVVSQRAAITNAYRGINVGTKTALQNALLPYLTGTRFIKVYDHSNVLDGIGNGGEWDVLIVTKESETPVGVDPAQIATDIGVKPAGVKLWHANFETTWSELETDRPTWLDWNGNTWRQVEETGWQ